MIDQKPRKLGFAKVKGSLLFSFVYRSTCIIFFSHSKLFSWVFSNGVDISVG